jgi:hypothetical protein
MAPALRIRHYQTKCHHLGMRINCQHRVAAATVPSSGAASLTICVSFITPVSAMALVAIPLLSLLVTGYSIPMIGMSIMLPLLFDHHYSPLPCFGSEVEPFLRSYCLVSLLSWLRGYLLTWSYCWTTVIVSRYLLSRLTYCLASLRGPDHYYYCLRVLYCLACTVV